MLFVLQFGSLVGQELNLLKGPCQIDGIKLGKMLIEK